MQISNAINTEASAHPVQVLMLCAEHGALAGAKVGGMADVLAGLPPALKAKGVQASVVMPGYGFLGCQGHGTDEAPRRFFSVPFRHGMVQISLQQLPDPRDEGLSIYLLDNPAWHTAPGQLYVASGDGRPFADDADRFALFGVAVAEALLQGIIPKPQVLHLHDWHQGFFALLRGIDPRYGELKAIPSVLSIHNLALQGTRPLAQEASSLAAWYPWLGQYPAQILDRRYPNCVNPLRAAICLSDRVHLVSPNYCREVLRPSDPATGFVGGEGLEEDLQHCDGKQQLVGILNGCDYPDEPQEIRPSVQQLVLGCHRTLTAAQANRDTVRALDFIAAQRLWQPMDEHAFLLTFVGRLTSQKVELLRHRLDGKRVLEQILQRLGLFSPLARFFMLGNGDDRIAREFQQLAARYDNFIFINHFDVKLSELLYRRGDLFLMPSSFEPCGISQMLAMRSGQPCLVSSVGGLVDTVKDGENGWRFDGDDTDSQARALLNKLDYLLHTTGTPDWQRVAKAALETRFTWEEAAASYLDKLYRPLLGTY
ncbi:glycogen synthase [Shewanella zhangzhouensis]|uniref:glycogen synthase n=1 Tax=Shewanella zhangzhouensis TaxID=2864213 RepID=UPI0021AC5F9D|nr:glycogen/starch synthase [Shewanella zhangzhouensis]